MSPYPVIGQATAFINSCILKDKRFYKTCRKTQKSLAFGM